MGGSCVSPRERGTLRNPCPTSAAGHPEPQPVHGRHGPEQQEAPHRVHEPQRELHAQQPRPGQGGWNSECPPCPAVPGPIPDSRLGPATAVQGVRRPGCDPEILWPPLQPFDAPPSLLRALIQPGLSAACQPPSTFLGEHLLSCRSLGVGLLCGRLFPCLEFLGAPTVCQDLGLGVSICCVSGSGMLMGPTVCPDLGRRVSCVLGPGRCVDM